jgi:two-component system phosphate regulon sensor histidine kinase PhoR
MLGLPLRQAFNEQIPDLIRGKELTQELIITDAYRQEIPIEINAKQVELDGKTVIQWAGRDMAARHEVAKMRQDMINMIVHDLRGPMGTMLGAIEMMPFLLEESQDQPGVTDTLDMVWIAKRTGKALRDLIDSVLDLSKLEQGNFPIKLNAIRLSALLDEVEDQVTPNAHSKQITLVFPKAGNDVTLFFDESMIRRILVNLVDNAIKYTPRGGQVRIGLHLAPTSEAARATSRTGVGLSLLSPDGSDGQAYVIVRVTDDGPGIARQPLPRLSERFYRVEGQRSGGTGLGLAIVKHVVNRHRGGLMVESAEGEGSTFSVYLPVAPQGT